MPPGILKDPEPPKTLPAQAQELFLENFAVGRVNYWISFCSDTAAAVFFTTWGILDRPARWPEVTLSFVAGFLLWGLSEYVFHRWAYHQERGIFGAGHSLHHKLETDYVAMPWFVSAVAVFAVWYVFTQVFKLAGFSEVLGGWMAGFVLYSWVHHAHHHWKPRGHWMRKMAAWHRIHHRYPDCNFGVTMRLWDTVFGTRFKGVHSEGILRR